jgi:hypothetical protein
MNCNTTTRYLGRTIQLFTTDAQVSQVVSSESIGTPGKGFNPLAGSHAKATNEAKLHVEDGKEISLNELGRGFRVHAGHRVTAVGAKAGKKGTAFLYFYNHDTRKGTHYRPGWKSMKRQSSLTMTMVILPLLLILALWMSPAGVRANMSGWVEEHVVLDRSTSSAASRSSTHATPGEFDISSVSGVLRSTAEHAKNLANSETVSAIDRTIRGGAMPKVTAGWREQDWVVFGVTAAVVACLLLVLRRVVTMPSNYMLRRKVKQLLQQHRSALRAA